MARYCSNCGAELPDGEKFCPNCGAAAMDADDAALFTKITAETEVWRSEADVKGGSGALRAFVRRRRGLIYAIAALLAAALIALAIVLVQPVSRVTRSLHAGDYENALSVYRNDEHLSAGEHSDRVETALLSAAEDICTQFEARETDAETASIALSVLAAFRSDGETLLADYFARFYTQYASETHAEQGDTLFAESEYLSAAVEYAQVTESDSGYSAAQELLAESLLRYAASACSEADLAIQSGDYAAALTQLQTAAQALLDFETVNADLEYKLDACYTLYESDLLAQADALAASEDYSGAAELIAQGMARFSLESEALSAAQTDYESLAGGQTVAAAVTESDALYDAGSYAEAFAVLEALYGTEDVEDAQVDSALAALESRFSTDKVDEAAALAQGGRDALPDAIAVLEDALDARELAALSEYRDELEQYLPVSLAELQYEGKTGTLFRSFSVFESLDGTDYADGWIWGENGAEVTFVLDGAYDLLEGTLAVRRDDYASAGGYFVVLCDGEQVYQSPTLYHWQTESVAVSVDISSCNELTLRFVNDYTASTADGGYCYHGLCSPTITKDLPQTAAEG
ncbi:MAG: zinc-ribbon domain-containing protein [Oscillospiraceae bacterium]|nr:zinc-ribbon domain-containing protein [Oscillospiraceae bacterium]